MAHELEMLENGTASMAYVSEDGVPWHGLGTAVSNDLSAQEMMEAAGVDWRVMELPSFVEVNGERIETGMKALVRERDNRVLTQVGPNWHPVQNEEAFDFFKEFVDAGSMTMRTAGSLKDGQIVWALARTSSEFELFGGDKVESYLLFSNPHQYGKSIEIRWTSCRVVCQNTLQLALQGNKSGITVNHRNAFDAENVKRIMGLSQNRMNEFREAAEFLGSKRATQKTMEQYFGNLLGMSNKEPEKLSRTAQKVMDLVETQPGAEFAEGTWWSALNAVTYATDHVLGRSADTRLQSAWYGVNRDLKVRALNEAIEMAKAA